MAQNTDVRQAITAFLNSMHSRVLMAKGEVTTQVSELLVFLGYFGLCLYAGGVAATETYNTKMKLAILSSDSVIATSQLFLIGLMGSFWSGLALVFGIIAISYIYMLARFAIRLWLGIAVVVGLFCTLMIFCIVLGTAQGEASAKAAFDSSNDSFPIIKVPDQPDRELSDGRYRLLHDSGTHLFLVRPTGAVGLGQIKSLLKKDLPSFEIIIK